MMTGNGCLNINENQKYCNGFSVFIRIDKVHVYISFQMLTHQLNYFLTWQQIFHTCRKIAPAHPEQLVEIGQKYFVSP